MLILEAMNSQQMLIFEQNLALVIAFIHDFFERKEIAADDDLIQSGVLDSLRTAELVYFLEARLATVLPALMLNEKTLRTPRLIASMLTELNIRAD